jgi:hypothetical protein
MAAPYILNFDRRQLKRFWIYDFGLRPGGAMGAYAPEGLRIYMWITAVFILK